MKVTLTSPVEGKNSGDSVTVDAERGEWLVAHGYASVSGDDSDKTTVTESVELPKPAKKTTRKSK